jgi:hypothetical protein
MPEICRFLGIVTTMFYDDHVTGTCPKNSVSDCIRTGSGSDWVTADKRTPVISMKSLPNLTRSLPLPVLIALRALTDLFFVQALRLVLEWCLLHKEELLINWELARQRKPLEPIEPLE